MLIRLDEVGVELQVGERAAVPVGAASVRAHTVTPAKSLRLQWVEGGAENIFLERRATDPRQSAEVAHGEG